MPVASAASYRPFGPLAGLTFGNGLAESRGYTSRYLAQSIQVPGRLDQTYTTDDVGNVLGIERQVGTVQWSSAFGYRLRSSAETRWKLLVARLQALHLQAQASRSDDLDPIPGPETLRRARPRSPALGVTADAETPGPRRPNGQEHHGREQQQSPEPHPAHAPRVPHHRCSPPFNRASRRPRHTPFHTFAPRSRSALPITDTDEKLIAAAASIGDSSHPVQGKSTPAAIGTPAAL
jgi:hypothetical protein